MVQVVRCPCTSSIEAGREALDIKNPEVFNASRLVEAGLIAGLDGFCIVKTMDSACFLEMSRLIEASLEKGLDEFCIGKAICLKPSRPGETRDSIILKGGSRGARGSHP